MTKIMAQAIDGLRQRSRIAKKPISKYGFSKHHDKVLDYCISNFGTCEFNCAKDGAPNCYFHSIIKQECAPAKEMLNDETTQTRQ